MYDRRNKQREILARVVDEHKSVKSPKQFLFGWDKL